MSSSRRGPGRSQTRSPRNHDPSPPPGPSCARSPAEAICDPAARSIHTAESQAHDSAPPTQWIGRGRGASSRRREVGMKMRGGRREQQRDQQYRGRQGECGSGGGQLIQKSSRGDSRCNIRPEVGFDTAKILRSLSSPPRRWNTASGESIAIIHSTSSASQGRPGTARSRRAAGFLRTRDTPLREGMIRRFAAPFGSMNPRWIGCPRRTL